MTAREKLQHDILQGLLMAAVVALALPVPDLAWAQAGLGASVQQVTSNELNPLTTLISAAFYIGGGVTMGLGAMKLKMHAENAAQNPMTHGIARVAAGAGLMAIPYVGNLAVNTLHLGNTASPFAQFSTIP